MGVNKLQRSLNFDVYCGSVELCQTQPECLSTLFLQQESDMLLQKNNGLSHDTRAIPQGTLHLIYPVRSSDLSYVEYAGDMMGPCLTHSLRPPTSLAVLRQYLQVVIITWEI